MRYCTLLCLCLAAYPATAQISLQSSRCYVLDAQWQTDAQFHIRLPEEPLAALRSGISLFFRLSIEEAGAQWWQSPRRLAVQEWHLDYNHLSQSYALQQGAQTPLPFGDVDSALKALGSIEQLSLDKRERDTPIMLRMQLSQAQLPFALRLNALFFAQWTLDSGSLPCQL